MPGNAVSTAAVSGAVKQGETAEAALRSRVDRVMAPATLAELDYLEFVDDETLRPVAGTLNGTVLVAIAVRFPGVRLIDNITVEVPE